MTVARVVLVGLAILAAAVAVCAQDSSSSTGASAAVPDPTAAGFQPWNVTLSGANPYTQAASTASFCDRLASSNGYNYSNPDHLWAAMYRMVSRAYNGAQIDGTLLPPVLVYVQGLIHNPNTIIYFNGAVNYRDVSTSPYYGLPTPNITADTVAAFALDDKLVRFLGSAFSCSGEFLTKYPYGGSANMVAVHSGMTITQTRFTAFINQFALAALSLGATQYDFDLHVVPFLQSFGRGAANAQGICNDATGSATTVPCACATGLTGTDCSTVVGTTTVTIDPGTVLSPTDLTGAATAASSSSVIILALAATVAIFAMLA